MKNFIEYKRQIEDLYDNLNLKCSREMEKNEKNEQLIKELKVLES